MASEPQPPNQRPWWGHFLGSGRALKDTVLLCGAQCGASEGDDFFRHAVPPPTPLRDLRLSRYVAPLSTFRIPFNPEIFVEFTSALSRIS